MESQFEQYVKDDCKQFNTICSYYNNKSPEDIDTLYALTNNCLILSARWSDISSNASLYAKKYSISKTDFYQWAYQRYRTLQEMHISCRTLYRCAREDLKANLIMEN